MLRIYLDQNKWIDLARAQTGHPAGRQFADVLLLALEATRRHVASFPISSIHYMEIYNAKSTKRRLDLANMMWSLARRSGNHAPDTIADYSSVVRMELDIALNHVFCRPRELRFVELFGVGIAHAFGRPADELAYRTPSGLVLPPPRQLQADAMIEFGLLAGLPADEPDSSFNDTSYREPSRRFQEADEQFASRIYEYATDKDFRYRAVAAREFSDLLEPLAEAMARGNIQREEFMAFAEQGGPVGLTNFLTGMPIRDIGYRLQCLRNDNRQTKRGRGDLNDIAALSLATAYCDVVVTERHWVHLLTTSKVAQKYGTIVLSDVRGLLPILATGTVTGN